MQEITWISVYYVFLAPFLGSRGFLLYYHLIHNNFTLKNFPDLLCRTVLTENQVAKLG
jgi:hypothetical protein